VHQYPHSFQGKFTIVNNGTTAINGWELSVVLSDDDVRSVWDGLFHTGDDTLYIDPSSSQQTIAPGATLTENFIASGSTTTPTDCMFNGSAC
jgi:chitinase